MMRNRISFRPKVDVFDVEFAYVLLQASILQETLLRLRGLLRE